MREKVILKELKGNGQVHEIGTNHFLAEAYYNLQICQTNILVNTQAGIDRITDTKTVSGSINIFDGYVFLDLKKRYILKIDEDKSVLFGIKKSRLNLTHPSNSYEIFVE